jgi:hypothetical protein
LADFEYKIMNGKRKNRYPIVERDNLPIQVGGFPIVISAANFYSYDNPLDKGA